MSNLTTTNFGRSILLAAMKGLTGRRLGKRLRRNFFLTALKNFGLYDDHGSLSSLVGDMNAAHDAELTQVMTLAGRWGQNRNSMSNEIYYVDPVNGDDQEGNGKVDHPFASLWFLEYCLPEKIDHNIRVLINGDITLEELRIQPKFGPGGSLSIIGVGAPTEVEGVQTITSITAYEGCTAIGVAGTPFIAGALQSTWLQFQTGDATGECIPIIDNTTDTIYITQGIGWTNVPIVTDTFTCVVPLHTITADRLIASDPSPNMYYGDDGSRITLTNFQIDFRHAWPPPSQNQMKIDIPGGCVLSMIRVLVDSNAYIPVELTGSINQDKSIDTLIETIADSGITNLDTSTYEDGGSNPGIIVKSDTPAPQGTPRVIIRDARAVRAVMCRDSVSLSAWVVVEACAFGNTRISGGNTSIRSCCLHGTTALDSLRTYNGFVSGVGISNVSFLNLTAAESAIKTNSSLISIDSIDAPDVGFIYGIIIEAMSSVNIETDIVAIAGISAAISFEASGTTHAAFPAAGATETDLLGSFVTRIP